MRITFKSSPLFTVTAEGDDHVELFTELASLVEIFSIDKCGACGKTDIKPIHRVVDDTSHFEMACNNPECRARLTLSQNKKGKSLYPRRKYADKQSDVVAGKAKVGDFIPNGGWVKFKFEPRNDDGESNDVEQPSKKTGRK